MRQITFEFFARKFNRQFRCGTYPEYQFISNNKRFCIRADLEKVYFDFLKPDEKASRHLFDPYVIYEYITLKEFPSLEDFYENASIDDGKRIKETWNHLDFIIVEPDYEYYFETQDWVLIKERKIYGTVKRIEIENRVPVFWVVPHNVSWLGSDKSEWIPCKTEDLEYDERPETIEEIKEAYACYLERLSTL